MKLALVNCHRTCAGSTGALYSVVIIVHHCIVVVSWRYCGGKLMISNNPAILWCISANGEFGTNVVWDELDIRKVDNLGTRHDTST